MRDRLAIRTMFKHARARAVKKKCEERASPWSLSYPEQ